MNSNKTNPIGHGKVQMSTTVPEWLDKKIKKLAAGSGVSRNEYVRALLADAAARHIELHTKTTRVLAEKTPEYKTINDE